jgi:tRNA nucleotidyltransferase/poly(A) polymerase
MVDMSLRSPQRAFQILGHQPAVAALLAVCGPTECHLVGGVLRDRALGLPVHDIDAVVAGRGREIGEELASRLPARLVLLGGKEFAAYRLVGEDLVVDLWDRQGTPLRDDLARRDFTVNSFAWEPREGVVIDPFGGLGDLALRRLRATTPASFTGDPLRVLRLPRLLLRLPGFTTDPDTLALARQAAPSLSEIAAERVREELTALFSYPEADRGLALLIALDLYPGLFLGHPGEPGNPGTALAELEALPGCVRDLRELAPEATAWVDERTARFSALFANLLHPTNQLRLFRDAGYLPRHAAAAVELLLELDTYPEDDLARRRFLHRAGPLWSTAAAALGARAAAHGRVADWRRAFAPLVDLVRSEGATLLDPPRLLTGQEVQEILGIPEGPAVGRALAAIRAAQVDGTVRTKEEAEELVRRQFHHKPGGTR